MFAFALWDKAEGAMLLCRDPAGVKPMYYQLGRDGLFFGSELKAIRALRPGEDFAVDRQAIGQFLQYGYIPEPRSAYSGVSKLAPAHWLVVTGDGSGVVKRYWDLPASETAAAAPRSEDDLLDELESLLVRSVKYRLVADVPIALFLSGGIDSSLVAAITAKRLDNQLAAYTVSFPDQGLDESEAAKTTARLLGLEHIVAPVTDADLDELLGKWSQVYDEPMGDPSGFPTYVVARLAARDYKVALSGDGGDELFGGYTGYLKMPSRLDALGRFPGPMRSMASQALAGLGRSSLFDLRSPLGRSVSSIGGGKLFDRTNRAASLLQQTNKAVLFNRFAGFWQPHEISRLLGIDYADDQADWPDAGDDVGEMMRTDFGRYLPDDVLVKVDRATMAVGLEGREPLLDRRLIEFAFGLPASTRMSPTHGKLMLRKILARFLPPEICYAAKKGFSVPLGDWIGRWMKNGAWDELRSNGWRAAGDLIDPDLMEGAYQTLSGSPGGLNRLWLLLVLQKWSAAWADGDDAARAASLAAVADGPAPVSLTVS